MFRLNKYIILCLTFLGLSGCNDFLDETPVTSISVDYIFATQGGLEVGVNALYNRMRYYNFPGGEGGPLRENAFFYVAHDLGMTRTWHKPYGPGHTPTGFGDFKWSNAYQIIDRASAIITGAWNLEMESGARNQILAEVKIIRAELYFDLLRMYDNILLDTIAVNPDNAFETQEFVPASPEAIYGVINSDLSFAVEHLEWSVPYGRYGQGVARHLKGKVAMWQGNWTEAATQFDAIVENGTHQLLTNVSQIFGQELNHAEAMFVYQRDQDLGSTAGGTGDNTAGGRGTWIGSMFNNRDYEMSGAQIIQSIEYGGQALGWSYPNNYLQSLYDQENDLRYSNYYYPMKKYVNNPAHPNFGQEAVYDDNYRRHHFSLKKFHDIEKGLLTNDSWKDIVYYRFAETLLLGAEAHMNLGGSSDATALKYINMIRRRAYGVDINTPNASIDFTTITLDTYLEESARELAFEKNRWFLLKRLGLLVERQNMHYTFGSSSIDEVPDPMAPHMVRLPIPQSQIDLMGTFPQNEGYF